MEIAKLGDCVEIISGFAFSASDFNKSESGLKIIRIQNVGKDSSREFVYWDKEYKEKFLINNGDLLLSLSGSFRAEIWSQGESLLNQRIVKIIPKSNIHLTWFFHWLNNKLSLIERMGKHALVNNVGITDLKEMKISIPTLDEQKRIAAILDKAEQTIQSSIRSLNSKSGLITSTFIEMFGDSFTNSKNWEMKPLGELGLHISDGNYSAKYPKVADFVKEGVPFLRANNLKNLSVNDDDMRHIPTDLHNNVLLKGHVKVNDILITTRGNIGQVGIVPKRHDDSNINAQLVLLRTEGSEIHHHYLLSVLDSEGLQHQFRKLQTGTALKQLPVSKLRKAIIPLPPMDLQISFSNLFNQMNSQISNALIELESLEALFSSLAQDLIA